jgi:hypothetical protein
MDLFNAMRRVLGGSETTGNGRQEGPQGNQAPIEQPRLSPRLAAEVQILRQAAGSRSKEVQVGPKTINGRRYTAVLVPNVRLDHKKFGVTTTDMLFLLPPDYPRLPPIGCYLNYKWKTADRHFTLQAHYGAPLLLDEGWYWYCVGLGGGFDTGGWSHCWRPATSPENGHNLATLFNSARYAVNHEV